MITDEMVTAYNRAYLAVWKASAPITQGEAVTVERNAVRAGLEAALDLTHTMQRTDDLAREVVQHQRALLDRIRPGGQP